jgi:hypothetical protein
MKKKDIILNVSPVRKNIDLPQWVVDEFGGMAEVNKNKFKPFVELTLINMAKEYRRLRGAQ